MSADDDVDWTGCALAQDCVHVIQCHVVNHSVVDFHDLIPTPGGRERTSLWHYACQCPLKPRVQVVIVPYRSLPSMCATDPGERVWM